MTFKKPLLIAGVATGIAFASVAGASATNSNNGERQDSLINKIATKFNLKPEEVKAVFEEQRAEHQAEHDKRVEDRLNKLVQDGKLTEAQKSAILAKRAEIKSDMEANRDSIKDMTPAERKAAMKAKKAELEAWAKANNIPTKYLHFVFGHGPGGHGHGRHGNHGQPKHHQDDDQTESQPSRSDDSVEISN